MHRGVYDLAERATAGFEGAREKVRAFVNAPSAREVIFTRSATEALNLVAYAWGLDNLGPGDVVVVTELEHHANFVPWQFIAQADRRRVPRTSRSTTRASCSSTRSTSSPRAGRVKVVANNLVSNTLGTINPVEKLAAWAHEQGAIMVVDAAQAAPHRRVDVQALGCDFLAFSSHKLCGPTRRRRALGPARAARGDEPFNLGGEMIRSVSLEKTTWNELPYKFEAGTPAIAEASASAPRSTTSPRSGSTRSSSTSTSSSPTRSSGSAEIPGVHVFGPPADRRAGIVSSTSTASTPTTSPRCSTWRASRSAPATTAPSR